MADKKQQYTKEQKLDYYSKRAADNKLTDKQRKYAQKRIGEITSGKSFRKKKSFGSPRKAASPGTFSNISVSIGSGTSAPRLKPGNKFSATRKK